MRMKKSDMFEAVLSFYADKKPHRVFEQFYWLKNLNRKLTDKQFLNIHKVLFMNGLIEATGSKYFRLSFVKRSHILTNKGDKAYREIAIENGGEYSYFKYFERKKPLEKGVRRLN